MVAILWIEVVLFAAFGFVQLAQQTGWLKGRHRQSELIYIFLSLAAKSMLGGLMFTQVLFV